MTTAAADEAILRAACERAGVVSATASRLSQHATRVWLLRDLGIVARIDHSGDQKRSERAVAVTRWLTRHSFPAVEPFDVEQPIVADGAAVTFWRHYPQGGRRRPEAEHLGSLLRRLHGLPEPPVSLNDYVPLVHLGAALRGDPPLSADDRRWLAERREQLLVEYAELDSALGVGFIHGDAYPGNLLWDGQVVRLGDWDETARGPRELDLVNTNQGARFGRSAAERQAFNDAYGWDVTRWSGYDVLREMRDLHTLGAYIDRAACGDADASAELNHRVATLRADDDMAPWHAA